MLFRVAQEAVRNTQRHAERHPAVGRVALDDDCVVLTVSDDGQGLRARARKAAEGHVGLRLLADLAAEAGGTFEVTSATGDGHDGASWRYRRGDPDDVLLVDDHQLVRSGLAATAGRSEDIEVVGTAANGAEAVEMARAAPPTSS